jgi:GR25 family glycosyltransferase involved in LPS biosynthesis
LPSRHHSVAGATTMIEQLNNYGFEAELFEGTDGNIVDGIFNKEERTIYPYSIKSKKLNQEEIVDLLKTDLPSLFWEDFDVEVRQRMRWNDNEIAKISNPGVKGCFHSHYRLWQHCVDLNDTIAIFEDDIVFKRPFEHKPFDEILMLTINYDWKITKDYRKYLEEEFSIDTEVDYKNYCIPGASGYLITPGAAKKLVDCYKDHYLTPDWAINTELLKVTVHPRLMGRSKTYEEKESLTRSTMWNKQI